jgi:hypothetical protein
LKRRFGVAVVFSALGGFVACNAILGNESEYHLRSGEAGESSTSEAGDGGAGGPTAGGATSLGGSGGAAGGSDAPVAGSGDEPGGATSTGGLSSTGGRMDGEGGEGNAPGATGGSAGEPSGGVTGTGGSGNCEPVGPEACFNSIDDDCNGQVDCEDEACDAGTRCVEMPREAVFGNFDGSACDPGVDSVELYQGLASDGQCDGCTCTPTTSDCDAGVYNYGAKTCGGFEFTGLLQNTFASSCQPLGGDSNIHFYSIRGITNCAASGTPRLPLVSWSTQGSFCRDDRVGGGCGASSACVADTSDGPECILLEGSSATCPTGYTRDPAGTWYTGYSDQRTCSECYCGFVPGACTGARLEVYPMAGCAGGATIVSNGEEGNACSLPFGAMSARIIGSADPNNCPPQSYPDDNLRETGAHTVCCR